MMTNQVGAPHAIEFLSTHIYGPHLLALQALLSSMSIATMSVSVSTMSAQIEHPLRLSYNWCCCFTLSALFVLRRHTFYQQS